MLRRFNLSNWGLPCKSTDAGFKVQGSARKGSTLDGERNNPLGESSYLMTKNSKPPKSLNPGRWRLCARSRPRRRRTCARCRPTSGRTWTPDGSRRSAGRCASSSSCSSARARRSRRPRRRRRTPRDARCDFFESWLEGGWEENAGGRLSLHNTPAIAV